MEKKVSHYPLNQIKKLIRENHYFVTRTAISTATRDFSFLIEDILNEVLNLEKSDFYKSMTSYSDNTLWQDVYKKKIKHEKVYIKVQIVDDYSVVISFKNEVEL